MRRLLRVISILSITLTAFSGWCLDPSLDWRTKQSEHFYIHYPAELNALAVKTETLAESIYQEITLELGWKPVEKTHLVLTDHTDFANGYATPIPYNRSVLFVRPPESDQFDFADWLESLIRHEFTHVVHLDKATGFPKDIRGILGRTVFSFPNIFQPSWLIEGLATYLETNKESRVGRGQSVSFSQRMQLELVYDFKSLERLNAWQRNWPLDAHYLYGYYFYEFLADSYGEESIRKLVDNYSNNGVPYFINNNARQTVRRNLSELWIEFEHYLRAKFKLENTESILDWKRQQEKAEIIHKNEFYIFDLMVNNSQNKIIWLENNGYERPQLKMLLNNKVQVLSEVNGGGKILSVQENRIYFSQPEICDEFNSYFDIYFYDYSNESVVRNTRCQRFKEAVVLSEQQAIGLRYKQGVAQLVSVNLKDGKEQILWTGDSFTIINDVSLMDQNTLLASVKVKESSRAELMTYSLNEQDKQKNWVPIIPTNSLTEVCQSANCHFLDAKPISGKDGLISVLVETEGQFKPAIIHLEERIIEIFDTSMVMLDDLDCNEYASSCFAVSHWEKGEQIIRFDLSSTASRKIMFSKEVNSPSLSNTVPNPATNSSFSSNQSNSSPYNALNSLMPTSWWPFAIGNEDTVEIGAQIFGSDALENHHYFLAASIDIDHQTPNLISQYFYSKYFRLSYNFFHDIDVNENDAAPDLIQRNRDINISAYWPFSQYNSFWNLEFGINYQTDSYYLWENDESIFIRQSRDAEVGVAASWQTSRRVIRSISPSDGREIRIAATSSDVLKSDFTGKSALIDWREYFSLGKQHVLAIRAIAASAEQGARSFKVGGNTSEFFSMYPMDLLERSYAIRGYPDYDERLIGRNLRILNAEWRFPISFIEKTWMAPPVGIDYIAGKLFYDSARIYSHSIWLDQSAANELSDEVISSYGAELEVVPRFFYNVPINFRLGYAKATHRLFEQDEAYFEFGVSF